MMISEGRGMHADSIPISSTIPGYPAWEITAMTKRPRSSTRDVTIVIGDCQSYFCSVVPEGVALLSVAARFSGGCAGLKPGPTAGQRHYNTRQHERVSRTNVEHAGDR